MNSTALGTVYLVGAGPGDPELLTLKSRRLIDSADVIYYDALVNEAVLEDVRGTCIFVGKRKGSRAYSQEEINTQLFDAAVAGNRVVRLKGGDPFIFGRGGEELLFLRERGVRCEVVPGISAALAAAAAAQIPLTHRNVAQAVSFCTGYPADRISMPDSETVVFYMASSSLTKIAHAALDNGASPDTPIALVYNATLPDESVWLVPAGELAVSSTEYPTPLLVVVGEVVKLSQTSAAVAAGQTAVRSREPYHV